MFIKLWIAVYASIIKSVKLSRSDQLLIVNYITFLDFVAMVKQDLLTSKLRIKKTEKIMNQLLYYIIMIIKSEFDWISRTLKSYTQLTKKQYMFNINRLNCKILNTFYCTKKYILSFEIFTFYFTLKLD